MTRELDMIEVEIVRCAAAFVRKELRDRDMLEELARFRRDRWGLRLESGYYVASWDDGEPIMAIPEATMAEAVGLLRAKRASRDRLN